VVVDFRVAGLAAAAAERFKELPKSPKLPNIAKIENQNRRPNSTTAVPHETYRAHI
jgi:hypothetical protein